VNVNILRVFALQEDTNRQTKKKFS